MPDQATDLRTLVRHVATAHDHEYMVPAAAARPRRIVVFGGKGGVGTTTIAVNLAAALAQQEGPSLLCDAAGGDAALQCGLEPRHTLADALAGTRTLAQVLQRPGRRAGLARCARTGPLARDGRTCLESIDDPIAVARALPRSRRNRCRQPARSIGPAALASGRSRVAGNHRGDGGDHGCLCFDQAADRSRAGVPGTPVGFDCPGREPRARGPAADEAQQRLAQACRRFLGLPLRSVGPVPEDGAVPQCAARGQPFVLAMPACPASLHLRQVVRALGNNASARQRAG